MPKEARPRNLPLFTEEEFEAGRPILLQGIQQYNGGYFFEAHETWEELWLQSPWPARQFLQGLIQVAAAFVHLMRREYPGTARLLRSALAKLENFPPDYLRIDVARLATEAEAARKALVALGPARFEEWDQRGIPQVHLLGARTVRGRASARPARKV